MNPTSNDLGQNPLGAPQDENGARIQGHGLYENQSGPGPRLMTAQTLEANKVMNRSGDQLGEIEDIMLDVTRGRIAYAVMAAGGILGVGRKLFAVPWSALTLDTDRHCFVMDASVQRFKDAPGFDKDHWPEQADEQWHRDIHSYYNAPTYWE